MNNPVIVSSRQLPEGLMAALQQLGELRVAGPGSSDSVYQGASVYVSPVMDPVDAELIRQFPAAIKLIANIGVGTDNVDLEAAAQRGIQVSNTPVVTDDTADLAMALLLASCRRLSACERLLRAGDWQAAQGQLGCRVHGKTLGIIGFGAIGQALARRASGFGMHILYHGPSPKEAAASALGAEYRAELSDLLGEADIVSLHCALTPATRHIINAQALSQMKSDAVLVNTGRGPLIDEAALVQALVEGQLGGAGLDVFEFEPQVTPQLLDLDNVTLLPHIGSATGECRVDMAMRAVANIQAFLSAGAPLDDCLAGQRLP